MLLSLILLISSANAHPVRHQPQHAEAVRTASEHHREIRWVETHYNRYGRLILGHWAVIDNFSIVECRENRHGTISCIVRQART